MKRVIFVVATFLCFATTLDSDLRSRLRIFGIPDVRIWLSWVERMECMPAKEPCCSPYGGPHPGPNQ